jgi:transposase
MDFTVKNLDHLGIIAGVMKDLKITELADNRLGYDVQVGVTSGEALTAMILNGLGFSNRVISLTPQFFENKPVELLIRKGIKAEDLNRHKLGRTLDAIADYGC